MMDYMKELDDIRREVAIARNSMRDCNRRIDNLRVELSNDPAQFNLCEVRDFQQALTKRQHEVLLLVCKGLSNIEIANQLYLSIRTVESYVSAILSQLDCRNRTELLLASKNRS